MKNDESREYRLDRRLLPLVVNTIPHGILTVDRNLNITSLNDHGQRLLGFSEDEAVGRRCSDVLHGDLCSADCPLRMSMEQGEPVVQRSTYLRTRDDLRVPVSVSAGALVSPSGKLLGGVEMFQDLSREYHLERELHQRYRFQDIVSKNRRMQEVFRLLPHVSESESNVLIVGQSGTGKELVARAIHNGGSRAGKPFVAINCAAVPATLLESELFGYKQGAFTDARRDKPGRIAQAEGGTLFLDEIGDMDFVLQAKLLRFLQERSYEPLGAVRAVDADVRVLTATNRDLESMVERNEFRRDLYYRLNVIKIELPSLAERLEDIPLLVAHFVHKYAKRTGKRITGMTDAALGVLGRYPFPGNVRELENVIERAFIVCDRGEIDVRDLPGTILGYAANVFGPASTRALGPDGESDEVTRIRECLKRHGGNRTRAAAELGIHRVTLVRKLKRLGIV